MQADDPVARLARHLGATRRTGTAQDVPVAWHPADEAGSYKVQQATLSALDVPPAAIGGWKVGASGPGPDAHFTCAPLLATGIVDGPGLIPRRPGPMPEIEAEICVRLAQDLPCGRTTARRAQDAIASCHPAIEWLQTRLTPSDRADPLLALADCATHGGLIVGAALPDWHARRWDDEDIVLTIGGKPVRHGCGNPGGEMMRMIAWLADHGAAWAGGLRAGQVVTTGSWIGSTPVPPDQSIEIRFATAGGVAARTA